VKKSTVLLSVFAFSSLIVFTFNLRKVDDPLTENIDINIFPEKDSTAKTSTANPKNNHRINVTEKTGLSSQEDASLNLNKDNKSVDKKTHRKVHEITSDSIREQAKPYNSDFLIPCQK